eukprot:6197341-Pleurochrysis_carterae.AAC.3
MAHILRRILYLEDAAYLSPKLYFKFCTLVRQNNADSTALSHALNLSQATLSGESLITAAHLMSNNFETSEDYTAYFATYLLSCVAA